MNRAASTAVPESRRNAGSVSTSGFLQRRSIKWKLITIVLLLTLFGLAIVFTGMTVNNRIVFERRLAHDMTVLADIIGNNSRAALLFDDPGAATEILAALRAKQHIMRAILYDAQGRRFAGYERARDASDPSPTSGAEQTGVFRDGYFAAARDIRLDERQIGRIYLATDLEEWNDSLRNYAIVFVLLALLTVGLTLALGILLQRVVTAPIGHLVETAREVSRRRDYGIRAMKTTGDELGVLVDVFNGMLAEIQHRDTDLLNAQAFLERRIATRTAQLETLNKELEAFSYSVSHDLRAPLRSIDGFSQALLEDYHDRLDAGARDYLQRVRAGVQRMAELIDDLLSLSRVTRSELRRERVDLSELARAALAKLRDSQPGRKVEEVVQDGLVAHADPRLLSVALTNLLDNAWKFTGKRAVARIEFAAKAGEYPPVYFVRDNGAGFDPAYAGKLFGAFQRLHDAREFPGTGVGLATVQRVVHKHGGRIWAEGAVDRGATFYFTL